MTAEPSPTAVPLVFDATDRGGGVALARIDTEANSGVTRAFAVQSLPAVFGIRDGQVVAQFVGVRPEAEIARFLDDLAPSAADRATQRARVLDGDDRRAALREALELDPGHHDDAIDRLLAAIELGGDAREPARAQLVALFEMLGAADPRVLAARPRLAQALF